MCNKCLNLLQNTYPDVGGRNNTDLVSKLALPPFIAADIVRNPELVVFTDTELLLCFGVKVIEGDSPLALTDRFRFNVLLQWRLFFLVLSLLIRRL